VGDLGVEGYEALVVGARERNADGRRSREKLPEVTWESIVFVLLEDCLIRKVNDIF
jgi:hypothetical protein